MKEKNDFLEFLGDQSMLLCKTCFDVPFCWVLIKKICQSKKNKDGVLIQTLNLDVWYATYYFYSSCYEINLEGQYTNAYDFFGPAFELLRSNLWTLCSEKARCRSYKIWCKIWKIFILTVSFFGCKPGQDWCFFIHCKLKLFNFLYFSDLRLEK